MSKLLLAISSWPPSAENGDHQASRDTFLKGADGLDYFFFMGDGTPIRENEQELDAAWKSGLEKYPHYSNHADKSDKFYVKYQQAFPLVDLSGREIMLPAPWDFKHLPFKVREIFRWARGRDYSHICKVDTDSYVDIPRLLTSGWENADYMGYPFWQDGIPVASGGAGYIVSRRSFEILADTPITIPFEDSWVGRTMHTHGIALQQDTRFRVNSPHEFSSGPRPDNDAITSHLGFSPEPYDNRDMYLAHKLRHP